MEAGIEYAYAAVGEDLLSLGRSEESLDFFRQAQTRTVGQYSPFRARVWRNSLADPRSGADGEVLIRRVSAELWAPVSPLIPRGTTQVIVVPSGEIAYVPFQALEEGGTALVERYAFSYLPSASVIRRVAGTSHRPTGVFIGALGTADVAAPCHTRRPRRRGAPLQCDPDRSRRGPAVATVPVRGC